jgi:peptidoglycan hydrolase CwlO-like protein
MCDPTTQPKPLAQRAPCDPRSAPSHGSRRRRLWDLPAHCHCPVIGVCLPLDRLRRLMERWFQLPAQVDDYSLHVRSVNECRTRTPFAEELQRELETRCALAVQRFRAAKTGETVVALWQEAVQRGDIAAPFWAALTHPRCDAALTERLYRDVHMLQHQAGAEVRVDAATLRAARTSAESIANELRLARQRHQQTLSEKAAEVERLQMQLVRARAELIARDTSLASLRQELDELKASIPDLATRTELSRQVEHLAKRNGELARQLAERAWAAEAQPPRPAPPAAASQAEPHGLTQATVDLAEKAVLCVGGRDRTIAIYRDMVERFGGRFAHHDGGREDSHHQLDAVLSAADLVICQTGCVSHNAYWLVKDHCKRTGKACVFLERSGKDSFARALATVATASVAAAPP